MYERNAIVLERYYNQMFGYNMKNNIKTNFKDYCELVECLEKYKNISEEEETIMQEYDSIANQIREIQKKQEILNKKNIKYQEERNSLFQNIDEDVEVIQKKFDNINTNIEDLNGDIKENAKQFVDIVAEFSEKTSIRMNCGRSRRNIENEYNKKLNETLDNYQEIDINFERRAKQFVELQTDDIEEELKKKIEKNGEKEKIPFNMDVIKKAIMLSIDIQKRETEILTSIYDKTNKLFTEIKNNATKSEKHKKTIKDSKCKIEFVNAIKEYLVQFLDNERLTAVNGEEEHKKLMKEACKNLEEDLIQINNLYTLLIKEICKKITKKSYAELYNLDYLKSLEAKSEEFEDEIRKLNLPVTIINPNYWRIEGMKKIYEVFYRCVTEEYDRDLSEYIPEEKTEIEEKVDFEEEESAIEEKEEKLEEKEIIKKERKPKLTNQETDVKAEIDKKIDMILGFGETDDEDDEDWNDEEEIEDFEDEEEEDDFEEEDNWDEDLEEDKEEDDDSDFDIWGNNVKEENEDDWEDEDLFDEEESEEEEEKEEVADEIELKPKIRSKKEVLKKKEQKDYKEDDDWENEFVNIDKREKTKKKKGFFDKFKK